MSSYNKVTIMGNLTQNPTLRRTNKGISVTDLTLALNRYWNDENGQRQTETSFVDVTVWGKAADNAVKYLEKGRSVLIEGRLQTDTWQDKDTGKNRSQLKVTAEMVQYIGGAGNSSQQGHQKMAAA